MYKLEKNWGKNCAIWYLDVKITVKEAAILTININCKGK